MLGVVVVYTGLTLVLLGGVSLLKPLGFLGIRTRRRGALVLGAGLPLVALGMLLPASETRVETTRSYLDEFVPAYQFSEFHRIRVRAPRDRVYRAVKEVTADEILFFRALTWLRRMGRPGPENILNAPERMPLLEVATRTSFLTLAEEPLHEIVVGTVVLAPAGLEDAPEPTPEWFKTLHAPSFAKAAMNFRLEEVDSETWALTTETRVYATDAATRRQFAAYWRVIYPEIGRAHV